MRKILLVAFIVGITCSTALAVDWGKLFGKKPVPTVTSPEEEILQSLTPTEAEARAIFHNRQRMLSPNAVASDIPPTQDLDTQIAVGIRYISVSSRLAEMIFSEPAMNWNMLAAMEPDSNLGNTPFIKDARWDAPFAAIPPGTAWSGTYTSQPMLVRFLDETNLEKFIRAIQSQRQNMVLEAPKFTFFTGLSSMINDMTIVPFVKGVEPIVVNGTAGYQPVVQTIPQGQRIEAQGTVLQDGSIRLEKCYSEFSHLLRAEVTQLQEEKKEAGGSRVSVQVPVIHSFRVNVPEIVFPSGMSLLMACPGMHDGIGGSERHDKWDKPNVFLLITARAVYPERRPVVETRIGGNSAPSHYTR